MLLNLSENQMNKKIEKIKYKKKERKKKPTEIEMKNLVFAC